MGLLGDESLELEQLGVVEIELVEVAVDDLLDQAADALEQFVRRTAVEGVEGARERRGSVDEAAHRVAPR